MKKIFVIISENLNRILQAAILGVLIAVLLQLLEVNDNLKKIRWSIPSVSSISEPVDVRITGVGREVEIPVEINDVKYGLSFPVNIQNSVVPVEVY